MLKNVIVCVCVCVRAYPVCRNPTLVDHTESRKAADASA